MQLVIVACGPVRTGHGSGAGMDWSLGVMEVEASGIYCIFLCHFARGPVGLFIDRQQRQATPDQRPHGAAEAAVLGHDTLLQADQPDGAIDGVLRFPGRRPAIGYPWSALEGGNNTKMIVLVFAAFSFSRLVIRGTWPNLQGAARPPPSRSDSASRGRRPGRQN